MERQTLTIGGKDYPCRVTMGAMVRYKRESGEDVSKLSSDDISGLVLFMYCCVKSACNADKEKFDMSFDDFADRLEPDGITDFYSKFQDSQKKT